MTDCKPTQITLVVFKINNDVCVQINFYVVHRFNNKVMHIKCYFYLPGNDISIRIKRIFMCHSAVEVARTDHHILELARLTQ